MNARRFWNNQDAKARDRKQFNDALFALSSLRNGAIGEFPALRDYLYSKHHFLVREGETVPERLTIDGYGQHDELTRADYESFKSAFLATTAGQADDWKIKPW
ncbi:MAG: hypothetical protein A2751_03885 [Candidatus Doudnabacteria bacterium RIFCSPHIGHO2_01_FULL_46_14]|uniref:Uncharacterized protein n=1 Tax=Candidatus Doudnabacteria bacterium RIFCSPHIGHO2_01_FULL_46_14 TaxID=1817824 RepID=A0A1F5NKU0_9BACT|nr:MAG: hypothetical protein A2751_03885 [Candidatus Doudnabacteria bacterium RIFCSPHIGHO2_01_FULL_46_14]